MVYNVFYWVHVVSFTVWILGFLAVMWKYSQIKNADTLQAQLPFIKTERLITNIAGHIGAIGILISGGAMASIPHGASEMKWGWFNTSYMWLTVKQGVFFLILVILVLAAINSVKFKKMLRNETDGELTPDAKAQWQKAFRLSMTIYALVLLNTFLGYVKPF
jgi:putative copper export protein